MRTYPQERRASRIHARANTQRPKRDRAPSRKRTDNNNTVSGVQTSVTGNPGNNSTVHVGQSSITQMSTSSLSNVCTLTDPNSVLDTVNSLAASVLAMQQQMQNMTNLMQNSLMSPQGTNHDQQLAGNREQTQSMDSVNRVQVTRQFINAAAVHSQNRTPTDLPDILCNSPVSVNACNSGNYINVSTCNGDDYITSMQYALPLGSMVSDQIKNKIWANDFVELVSCYLNLSQNQDPNL